MDEQSDESDLNRRCVSDVEHESIDPIYGVDDNGIPNHSPTGCVICPTGKHWQYFPVGPCDSHEGSQPCTE